MKRKLIDLVATMVAASAIAFWAEKAAPGCPLDVALYVAIVHALGAVQGFHLYGSAFKDQP